MRCLLVLLALAIVVVAWTDEVNAPQSGPAPASARVPAAQAGRAGTRRAFIFVIDSLAYEEACDASLMPNLVALRKDSAFAKVQASRDAVTSPALRAAFTGSDSFRVFGFVRNFVSGSAALDSVFGDARRAGLKTAAWSDGAFDQFGADVQAYRSNESSAEGGDEVMRQTRAGEEALLAFLRAEFDVVAFHETFTDHAAHMRVERPDGYREAFREADRFVGRLAEAVPREDVLLVMGDHGHTHTGVHALGMDVPTFALYRGRAFAEVCDFSPAQMTDHRHLLGFGLQLTEAKANAATSSEANPPSWPFLVMAGGAGGLGALWLAWVWGAAAGTRVRLAGTGVLAGLAFLAWGVLLAHVRRWVHEPPIALMEALWAGAILAGLALCRFRGPRAAVWWVLGAGVLLLYPTVYRYGSMVTLLPVWTLLLVLLAAAVAWHRPARSLATAGLAFLFLQPFALPDSFSFRFASWRPLLPDLSPSSDHLCWVGILAILIMLACLGAQAPRPRFKMILTLAAAASLYLYLVRVPASFHWQLACVLAALALTARLASNRPEREHFSHHVFLLCLAVISAGWCTLAFGVDRLEWQCLYDWFSPSFVEKHMPWFLPVILGRYALPLIIVRVVLGSFFPDPSMRAERRAIALVGLSVMCILCVGLGMSRVMPGSSLYLESCQHAGVLWCVALGLACPLIDNSGLPMAT